MKASPCMLRPLLRCGVWCVGVKKYLTPTQVILYIMYARELVGKVPCRRMNLRVCLEVWVIFSTFALAKETNGLAVTRVV